MTHSKLFLADVAMILENTLSLEKLSHKRILITGATGQIGSYLIQTLAEIDVQKKLDLKIIAVGRSQEKLEQIFADFLNDQTIEFVIQDFSRPVNWQFDCDYVIHAASNADPKSYREDPIGTMTVNFNGTLELLNYARKMQIQRFVFISTGEIYGETDQAQALVETDHGYLDSMSARACYPVSKLAAETLCASYHAQYGVDVVVLRLSHIFGPNFSPTDSRIASTFLREAVQGRDLVMHSIGAQIRSYTYISDCVSGILRALLAGESGAAYNVSNSANAISLRDFCEKIAIISGVKLKVVAADAEASKMATPIDHAVLADEKLKQLGWQPKVSVTEGLERTIRRLKE